MIQLNEMKATRPMQLHGGVIATTTDIWNMLTASRDGDLPSVKELAERCPLDKAGVKPPLVLDSDAKPT